MCILGLWVKVFPTFGCFFANLPKPHSKSSDKHFGEFFGKNSFPRFSVQTFSEVQQNLNRRVVKTSSYLFRKPVEETDCFEFSNVFGTYSNFGRKFFQLLAKKTSRKDVKNSFLHVQGIHLEEKNIFFSKTISGLTSKLQAKFFLTIG